MTEEAEHWWLRAADAGNINAMLNLAYLYQKQGCNDNAEHWYNRIAEGGDIHFGVRRGSRAAPMSSNSDNSAWTEPRPPVA
jgi:hypothetical protein